MTNMLLYLSGCWPTAADAYLDQNSIKDLNSMRKECAVEEDQPFSIPTVFALSFSVSLHIPICEQGDYHGNQHSDVPAEGPDNDQDRVNAIWLVSAPDNELDELSGAPKLCVRSLSDRTVPAPVQRNSDAAGKTAGRLQIRKALESPGAHQHDRVCCLNAELQRVVTKIRGLPGLSRFLLPLFPDLQQVTCEGPVITVNANKYGCDALVVLVDRHPLHILLSITKEGVCEMSTKLDAKSMDVTKGLSIMLRELSLDEVVCPITARSPAFYIKGKHLFGIGQAQAKGENPLVSVDAELANIGQRVDGLATFTHIEGKESCIARVTEELMKKRTGAPCMSWSPQLETAIRVCVRSPQRALQGHSV
ncbi:hypothetical protein J3R82DRAFT_6432 [Butyriboletus roseoflavus]|nr:hypothetical protein J3R82DRAFT_6432 [Butyriboletus roseoflavus]